MSGQYPKLITLPIFVKNRKRRECDRCSLAIRKGEHCFYYSEPYHKYKASSTRFWRCHKLCLIFVLQDSLRELKAFQKSQMVIIK